MDYENWMSDLKDYIGQLSLIHIPLVGTHDSGSYAITPHSLFSPESHLAYLNKFPDLVTDTLKLEIFKWAKTQTLTISEQLKAGARYLDIRVCQDKQISNSYDNQIENLYTAHTLLGATITSLINEVSVFTQNHPYELIILDFNHFYEMDTQSHLALLTGLFDKFSKKMVPNIYQDHKLHPITLNDCWEQGQQVIIMYDGQKNLDESLINWLKEHPYFWSSAAISSPWPNTDNPKQLIEYLDDELSEKKPQKIDCFKVLQAVLTPKPKDIFNSLTVQSNDSLLNMADTYNPQIIDWFKDQSCSNLNIIIMDAIGKDDPLLDVIIKKITQTIIPKPTIDKKTHRCTIS